jgi:hypothetical protein
MVSVRIRSKVGMMRIWTIIRLIITMMMVMMRWWRRHVMMVMMVMMKSWPHRNRSYNYWSRPINRRRWWWIIRSNINTCSASTNRYGHLSISHTGHAYQDKA